jgi:hypothetical protein
MDREPRTVRFTVREARQLELVLSSAALTEREERVRGRLVGANVSRDTFELVLDDGRTIRGRVLPDLREAVAAVFARLCDVTLEVSVATSEVTGATIEKFVLAAIDNVD